MKKLIGTTTAVAALMLAGFAAPDDGTDETKDAAPLSVERPGHGGPVCGLGKDFHAGRRAELMARLEGELLVFRGLPEQRNYVKFSQDKVFWYLTGVETPEAALILDGASGRQILFLPEYSGTWEVWNGPRWDVRDDWIGELTGFGEVRELKELAATLEELLAARKEVWTSLQPHVPMSSAYDQATKFDIMRKKDPLDGRESRERAFAAALEEKLGVKVRDVSDELNDMRRVKQPIEVDACRRAAAAGAAALVEAMRAAEPGVGEWEIDALMGFVHVQEGAEGPAYNGIVASGPNSCALHYLASSRRMQAGDVLLIDYGPEVDHYVTDITRTWPVDGVWTARQAELYDAVLAAQEAGIAAVKPGVTMRDVSAVCDDVLRERGMIGMRSHSACHYVGMEVHDPGDYLAPLEAGAVITVEPGLYDRKLGIGIRIEDTVVVTADGCEVLSQGVPKARAEIDALVAQEGLLKTLDRRPE